MSNFPLVSILIPAYNHEKFVRQTIQSVINQTYKNIELIVIDDGSKDRTWDILQSLKKECEERFVRVDFATQKNAGTCITLNRLLNKAHGDFISIVASDDCMAAHGCERMIDFLCSHSEYILAVGDNEIIDGEGKIVYWDKERNIVYDKNKAIYFRFSEFLQRTTDVNFLSEAFGSYNKLYISNHIPNGYIIRKNIFDKIQGFTKDAPLEDWYLMLQISKYGKMKFIDDVLFYYRWHGGNTIINNEKIKKYINKTREYENKLLLNIDRKTISKDVINVIEKGVIYKRRSFLGIFEIVYIMTIRGRIKEIRLFGNILCRYYKD